MYSNSKPKRYICYFIFNTPSKLVNSMFYSMPIVIIEQIRFGKYKMLKNILENV